MNGKMLVWCRKCSGYTRVTLGRKLLSGCQEGVGEKKKRKMLNRIPKLEEGQAGMDWIIEGRKEGARHPEGFSKA